MDGGKNGGISSIMADCATVTIAFYARRSSPFFVSFI